MADIIADKQSFRVPTTVQKGASEVIRVRGFTHVATTLTLVPTAHAADVPEFNPLTLVASDNNQPDVLADPGPPPDDTTASFTTRVFQENDLDGFAGELSTHEVEAQIVEFQRNMATSAGQPEPSQLLLTRTSSAGRDPTTTLGYADDAPSSPFSSIDVRMIPENVTTAARTDPTRNGGVERRLVVFRHGDALQDILRTYGASAEQIRSIFRAFGSRRGEAPVGDGRRLELSFAKLDDAAPRQIVRISVYADETLETTIALSDRGDYVQVARASGPPKPPDPEAAANDEDAGGMRLYNSFYETALKQAIPKALIDTLLRVFANDVDFQRAVTGGDSFEAFYADSDHRDDHVELLHASITVGNEAYSYYRFQKPTDSAVNFYDENGRTVRKFLMRNPVPNARFTSAFGMRFHPILGYARPHTGVDWAAPIGTPILAAGSGTVLRAERESAYGNRAEIQHPNGYITTYSHMMAFARGITAGDHIRQGQTVGYLGQTGLATGPHLHYEVKVNGRFVDPMRVKLAETLELDGNQLTDFRRERDRINALMANAPNAVILDAQHKHAWN